jgi:hypothetical protein
MKKLLFAMTAGGALLACIFPRHETLSHTYQTSLWTYPFNNKALTFAKKPPEICCRFGGRLPQFDLIEWDRFRLGYPFGAITIDCQSDNGILQVRGELAFLAVNLGCGAAVGFTIFCALLPYLLRRNQKQQNKPAHPTAGNVLH